MTIINLTPHSLVVINDDERIVVAVSGNVARIGTTEEFKGTVDGIPLYSTSFTEVVGLPDPAEGTFYVVPRLVIAACPERKDLVAPHGLIRNEKGQVIGCKGLSR